MRWSDEGGGEGGAEGEVGGSDGWSTAAAGGQWNCHPRQRHHVLSSHIFRPMA